MIKRFLKLAAVLLLVASSVFGQSATKVFTINVVAGTSPAAGAPNIFFTDLDSGPNSGGDLVNGFAGAYVTLYGNNFGTSQGTSTVTWNGQNCLRVLPATGAYTGWGMAYLWYQKIIVQLGAGCTAGTGNFVVTTANGASTGVPFTVRAGNIFCISTTGSDSANGKFPNCWLTPAHAFTGMAAGDTAYWENGVTVTTGGGLSGLDWGLGGSAGNPVAMVSYPGATPQPGIDCTSNNCSNGIAERCSVGFPSTCQYFTMAGLKLIGQGQAVQTQYTSNGGQRYVGNYFTCVGSPGQVGCFEFSQVQGAKFFGNEVANVVSTGGLSKFYHALYLSTDSNHIEVGWNSVHNNNTCRAIQLHSSPNDLVSGFQLFDISLHDNLIHDDPCDGILVNTVDPSKGKIEVYNNIIYHVGIGPDPLDGEGDYTCIRVANGVNNGAAGSGTVEIYNNTLTDCSSHPGTQQLNGALDLNPGPAGVNFRNNIVSQPTGQFFTNNGSTPSGLLLAGSNNIWFGTSQATPTWTTGNITTNPLFVNAGSNDYHLQVVSPAINAGVTVTSSNSFNNYVVWNGTPEDRDGNSRPQGSAYDIGAYEYPVNPTFVYSNAYAVATPSGTSWGGAAPCGGGLCERAPIDPNIVQAGNTILLRFCYDSTGNNQVFSITDDKGDTYSTLITSTASNNKTCKIYGATNVIAGVNWLQMQLTSGASNHYWQPEIIVLYNANALDGASCASGTGTSIAAGSITPTVSGDFIWQSSYSTTVQALNLPARQSAVFAAGSQANITWALASQLLSDGSASQYGVYNSTAAINPTFTSAASDSFISCAVALKAAPTGSTPTQIPRVVHQAHDAMPHNAANPFHAGIIVDTPKTAVYLSYVGNDQITAVSSSPVPDIGWTPSGADFVGQNGHNHVNSYCAVFNTPPGAVNVSITRAATSNDSINMFYTVQNGTCNVDADTTLAGNRGAGTGSFQVGSITPLTQNDIIFSMGGQFACTVRDFGSGISDSNWYTPNTIDGPTQTDENNGWAHYYNGSSLAAVNATWNDLCDANTQFWANRMTAYKSQ